MIIGFAPQQPNERIDYDIDCTSLFINDSDSISEVTASVTPAGLTVAGVKMNANTAKIWVSGGVTGVEYTVTVRITTANNRIKEDEILIGIEEIS